MHAYAVQYVQVTSGPPPLPAGTYVISSVGNANCARKLASVGSACTDQFIDTWCVRAVVLASQSAMRWTFQRHVRHAADFMICKSCLCPEQCPYLVVKTISWVCRKPSCAQLVSHNGGHGFCWSAQLRTQTTGWRAWITQFN